VDVVGAFRFQAEACARLGSPMYGELVAGLADDIAEGGPTARVIEGFESDSGPSALALRLMGSVHRLVLAGQAPSLAPYYPSVGGTYTAAALLPLLGFLEESREPVRELLPQPPQTNEVGRAACLYGGLLHLPPELRHPVRLFEMGSSAGLNLRADRFAYVTEQGVLGDPSSPVRLDPAWNGRSPEAWPLRMVERVGADLAPIDPRSEAGRLTLSAYVWPDMPVRLERLRAAFEVADVVDVELREQDAASFVGSVGLAEGVTTVLWHSVMWQYVAEADQRAVADRIDDLGARATVHMPFAHLSFEPTRRTSGSPHEFLVTLQTWPGARRVLGRAAPHGVPVQWEQ
jgi:hypothetical protein